MKKIATFFLRTLGILFISAGVLTTSAYAQASTGQIEGRIVDSQNDPVPFAAVTLKMVGTSFTRGTSANDDGVFRFDDLRPGKYTVTARRVGFDLQSRDLEISVGQTTSVSFTMISGEMETEQVEVLRPSYSTEPQPDAEAIRWYAFEEGVALAEQTGKKLLIKVYTDWCGVCKKMDKEVYTNGQVKDVLQMYFVPVKLNAESSRELTYKSRRLSEMTIAREMRINRYPTTVFLRSNTEPIRKVAGYIESEKFAKMLRSIGQAH